MKDGGGLTLELIKHRDDEIRHFTDILYNWPARPRIWKYKVKLQVFKITSCTALSIQIGKRSKKQDHIWPRNDFIILIYD
jgi:hypothetical protein